MPYVARLYTGSSQNVSLMAEVTFVDVDPSLRNLRASHALIDAADLITVGWRFGDDEVAMPYNEWTVLKNKNGWNLYKVVGLSDEGYQPYQLRKEHY